MIKCQIETIDTNIRISRFYIDHVQNRVYGVKILVNKRLETIMLWQRANIQMSNQFKFLSYIIQRHDTVMSTIGSKLAGWNGWVQRDFMRL